MLRLVFLLLADFVMFCITRLPISLITVALADVKGFGTIAQLIILLLVLTAWRGVLAAEAFVATKLEEAMR